MSSSFTAAAGADSRFTTLPAVGRSSIITRHTLGEREGRGVIGGRSGRGSLGREGFQDDEQEWVKGEKVSEQDRSSSPVLLLATLCS